MLEQDCGRLFEGKNGLGRHCLVGLPDFAENIKKHFGGLQLNGKRKKHLNY
jgi:hypothetical protein